MGVLTLSRPPVNAVTFDFLGRIAAVVSEPDRWFSSPAALVMAAAGPHFSAGMDRGDLKGVTRERLTRAADDLAAVLHSPLPLVSAVHGAAAGTGFILAACADLLVIDPEASVWLPEVELGMLGGAGYARRWMPSPLARWLVLTGEKLPGTVLHAYGALAPPNRTAVRDTALELAAGLAQRSPGVMAAARQVLAGMDVDAAAIHRHEMETTPIPNFETGDTEDR